MAKRKGWDALSPAYRQRLQRSGIDEIRYTLGVDLKRARGHTYEGQRARVWRKARRQFQHGRASVYEPDAVIKAVFDAIGYEAAEQVLDAREMAIKGDAEIERELGRAAMRVFYGQYSGDIPDEWLYYNDYTF